MSKIIGVHVPRADTNYIISGGVGENGTAGWTTYADANSGVPVDLTGGSPTATWTRTTTNPLRGSGSFLFTAGTQGDGAAYTITPDRADIKNGAILAINLEYESSATIATGDYIIAVYDVANSIAIQPSGYQIPGSVTGIIGKCQAKFQLPTNGTTFRVSVHQAVSSPGGNLKVDSFAVGPQSKTYGAPVTDWTSYTPTFAGLGTVTGIGASWRRVGDSVNVRAFFTTGTTAASTASISLPSGLTLDSTKAGSVAIIGRWTRDATDQKFGGMLVDSSSSSTVIYFGGGENNVAQGGLSKQNGSTIINSTQNVSVDFTVPISGWASSVVMSNDTDTRVVAAKAYALTPTGTLTTAFNTVIYGTVDHDTHGAYNATTGTYTAPVSGDYDVTASTLISGTYAANTRNILKIYVNGGATNNSGIFKSQSTVTTQQVTVSTNSLKLNAGDLVTIRLYTEVTSPSYASDADANYFTIARRSGPATIADSEAIMACYSNAASTTTLSTSSLFVDYANKQIDTHNAVQGAGGGLTGTSTSTWRFVCPAPGVYECSSSMTTAGTGGAQIVAILTMNKNGVSIPGATAYSPQTGSATSIRLRPMVGPVLVRCVAGDILNVSVSLNTTPAPTLSGIADCDHVTIRRVGL
jgi:hypothetical protein